MAHEVTMPQLGMAQDSGVITAWLKVPGAQVRAGEPLFEVETDKATMEIEAQADGWLSPPRYQAGQEAPVGAVIAHLAESAEAAQAIGDGGDHGDAPEKMPETPADTPTDSGGDGPTDGGSDDLPAGTAVIMPALGMAQDSGVLLGWLKEPGAAIKAGEPLFEVETDKASMEVEAGRDGYLAATLAAAGDEIPVGQTIAVIADAPAATPLVRSLNDAPAGATPAPASSAPIASDAPARTIAPPAASVRPAEITSVPARPARTDGRILASPKARRLAQERGLDLARLVRMGVPQPYHVADLETLAQAGPDTTALPPGHASGAVDRYEAEASATPLSGLLDWLEKETGAAIAREAVLAAFAAGALRATLDPGDAPDAAVLKVQVSATSMAATTAAGLYRDPDLAGLAHAMPADDIPADLEHTGAVTDTAPDLVLRDLGATRLRAVQLAGDRGAPVLTLTCTPQGVLHLVLTVAPGVLSEDAAIALLDGFAGRLDTPLRHLL